MSVMVADGHESFARRGDGGAVARRAVARWGWRLFRREWRRHFLIIVMLMVAVAGFTVMAQRRLRSLGMLASLGATDKHVRLVMLSDGAAVGVVGALAGGIVGLGAWFAFVPTLESLSGHRIDRLDLPWWAVTAGIVLAVLTAIAAAWWPARGVARTPVVAALSGRPSPPQPAHRFAAAGVVVLAVGLALLFFTAHDSEHNRP